MQKIISKMQDEKEEIIRVITEIKKIFLIIKNICDSNR